MTGDIPESNLINSMHYFNTRNGGPNDFLRENGLECPSFIYDGVPWPFATTCGSKWW